MYMKKAIVRNRGIGGVRITRKGNVWSKATVLKAPGAKTVTWHVLAKALAISFA
jgi:hypothetical protein